MKDLICNIILDNKKKELNSHGTPQLPISAYNDDLKVTPVPYHWHDEIEFIVVVDGDMEVVVEFEKLIIKTGEGIFINSGRLHSCRGHNNSSCIIKSFVLHARFLYGDINSSFYEKYFHHLLLTTTTNLSMLNYEESSLLISAYNIFVAKEYGYEFFVRENLTKATINIMKKTDTNTKQINAKTQKKLSRCKLMMKYIEENFSNEISLLDIANSASIKESEALRCFKSILSTSPIKYLKSFRIQKAGFFLKNTNESIINIALNCGFYEMSYFSKSFKEMYGVTPTNYRNHPI